MFFEQFVIPKPKVIDRPNFGVFFKIPPHKISKPSN